MSEGAISKEFFKGYPAGKGRKDPPMGHNGACRLHSASSTWRETREGTTANFYEGAHLTLKHFFSFSRRSWLRATNAMMAPSSSSSQNEILLGHRPASENNNRNGIHYLPPGHRFRMPCPAAMGAAPSERAQASYASSCRFLQQLAIARTVSLTTSWPSKDS